MNINKKIYIERVARQVFIFHIINIAGWFSLSTAQHYERKI